MVPRAPGPPVRSASGPGQPEADSIGHLAADLTTVGDPQPAIVAGGAYASGMANAVKQVKDAFD